MKHIDATGGEAASEEVEQGRERERVHELDVRLGQAITYGLPARAALMDE